MELTKEIVTGVRGVRARKNIPQKEALTLRVIGQLDSAMHPMIKKLANVDEIVTGAEKDAAAQSFMVGTLEFNIPLAGSTDVEAEKARVQKEIDYLLGFKASIEKKLSNERFVNNAPEAVVAGERKKLSDANSKIETLRATLAALK